MCPKVRLYWGSGDTRAQRARLCSGSGPRRPPWAAAQGTRGSSYYSSCTLLDALAFGIVT